MDSFPPTRNMNPIILEVSITGTCCSCRSQDGILRCSRCKAVNYCGQDCQKKSWKDHSKTCNEIRQKYQETTAALDALVKGTEDTPDYVQARWSLTKAYAKCGRETFSRLAFQLAVENLLDLLQITRNDLLRCCSWMVAGGRDQLALNFLCYFTRREQGGPTDVSVDEDIEGASCVNVVQEINTWADVFSVMGFHTFMLISLIKIKRLQALLAEGRKEDAGWNAFMEGTHPGTGASSVVLRIGGVDLITEKIREFVVDQSRNKRIDLLAKQINGLLEIVNETNPQLMPGVIDRETLEDPAFPDREEDGEFLNVEELNLHLARQGVNIYGYAWHMDREYIRVLRLFLDTGNVMGADKDTGNVMGTDEVTGKVIAADEDTGNPMATDEDTGNAMADDKNASNLIAADKDTGNVMAEEGTSL